MRGLILVWYPDGLSPQTASNDRSFQRAYPNVADCNFWRNIFELLIFCIKLLFVLSNNTKITLKYRKKQFVLFGHLRFVRRLPAASIIWQIWTSWSKSFFHDKSTVDKKIKNIFEGNFLSLHVGTGNLIHEKEKIQWLTFIKKSEPWLQWRRLDNSVRRFLDASVGFEVTSWPTGRVCE